MVDKDTPVISSMLGYEAWLHEWCVGFWDMRLDFASDGALDYIGGVADFSVGGNGL